MPDSADRRHAAAVATRLSVTEAELFMEKARNLSRETETLKQKPNEISGIEKYNIWGFFFKSPVSLNRMKMTPESVNLKLDNRNYLI